MSFIHEGEKIIKTSRSFIRDSLHDTMIRNSVFAAIVFLIVAHPTTFQFVDSILKIKNHNVLVFVHAVVFTLIMYFGSIYVFTPVQHLLFEGYRNPKKN